MKPDLTKLPDLRIGMLIAYLADDAKFEIREMAKEAMRAVDEILGIPAPF